METGNSINFYTIVEAACRKGEIATGYGITTEKDQSQQKYGVYLNPDKEAIVTLTDKDQVIVVAEVQ